MPFFNLNKKVWQWILLIFLSFVWGASFILMKKGLMSFSPMHVGTIRIFVASLFLTPFIFTRLKKFKKKYLKSLLIVGFIGNLIPAVLFALAQTKVSSSLAGMLNTMFPIIAIIIGSIIYGVKTPRYKIFGIIIGLIGAIGLVFGDDSNSPGNNNYFAFYIFLAVIMYAFSINEMKYKLKDLDGMTITAFAFTGIGLVSGIYLLFSDFSYAVSTPDFNINLLYVVLLGIGGSAIATTLFYILVDHVEIVFASLITYIIPVFALFWGLLDGENLTQIQGIFMFVVFIGVFIVNRNGEKNKN